MTSTTFFAMFDVGGKFRTGTGEVEVSFATISGGRFSGRLGYDRGYCIRATMGESSRWENPDRSPLDGVRFVLAFEDQASVGIGLRQGRTMRFPEPMRASNRIAFLSNFRAARNLFDHASAADGEASPERLRSAVWLAPSSVADFQPDDFPELDPDRRTEVELAIEAFLSVARGVPADRLPSPEEYRAGIATFSRLLELLGSYVRLWEEAERVETVLRGVSFEPWIVNWDYEFGTNSNDEETLRIDVFTDDSPLPSGSLGEASSRISDVVRVGLSDNGIRIRPSIRIKSSKSHRARNR